MTQEESKTCIDCKKDLPLKDFYYYKYFNKTKQKTISKHFRYCKKCTVKRSYKNNKKKGVDKIKSKKCIDCGKTRLIKFFHFDKKSFRYCSYCKDCNNVRRKTYTYDKNLWYEKQRKANKEKGHDKLKEKKCSRCKKVKSTATDFYFNKQMGCFQAYCKKCLKAYREEKYGKTDYDKKYYQKNKKHITERVNKWHKENEEYLSAVRKEYVDENKDKILAHKIVREAVRDCELITPNKCECCKNTESLLDFHHMNYKKALEGIWLCRSCHIKFHNGKDDKHVKKVKKLWKKKYG